jgi:hypothetical protein
LRVYRHHPVLDSETPPKQQVPLHLNLLLPPEQEPILLESPSLMWNPKSCWDDQVKLETSIKKDTATIIYQGRMIPLVGTQISLAKDSIEATRSLLRGFLMTER